VEHGYRHGGGDAEHPGYRVDRSRAQHDGDRTADQQ
jgi:hypothetical protein